MVFWSPSHTSAVKKQQQSREVVTQLSLSLVSLLWSERLGMKPCMVMLRNGTMHQTRLRRPDQWATELPQKLLQYGVQNVLSCTLCILFLGFARPPRYVDEHYNYSAYLPHHVAGSSVFVEIQLRQIADIPSRMILSSRLCSRESKDLPNILNQRRLLESGSRPRCRVYSSGRSANCPTPTGKSCLRPTEAETKAVFLNKLKTSPARRPN